MNLNDTFSFGLYKGLSLAQVYQGTKDINKTLIRDFLNNCLTDIKVPKPAEFEFYDFLITVDEIVTFPQIFDENQPYSLTNTVNFGDLSNKIEAYFNSFFRKNWYGVVENLPSFNSISDRQIIGGDPEYIQWCLREVDGFIINAETRKELEQSYVNRLIGITVSQNSVDKYSYTLNTKTELFKFNNFN